MPLVLLPGFFSADCRVFPEACDALLELTELSLRAAASGSATTFDQARAAFERAWQQVEPTLREDDFEVWRRDRDFHAWKRRMQAEGC